MEGEIMWQANRFFKSFRRSINLL